MARSKGTIMKVRPINDDRNDVSCRQTRSDEYIAGP